MFGTWSVSGETQWLQIIFPWHRVCTVQPRFLLPLRLATRRLQLFVVGHRQTLSGDGDWRKVAEALGKPRRFLRRGAR